MTNTTAKQRIETVTVTAGDRILDCVSFASRDDAEAYKSTVRSWAVGRGVIVRVFSHVANVADGPGAYGPGLALAS